MEKEYRPKYGNQLFNNAQRFSGCIVKGDLSILKTFSRGKQLNVMKALSALSKFSGCYERYKQMIKAYGLKWAVDNDDIIINRLIKYSNNSNGNGEGANELFEWIKRVKRKIPEFAVFMDFAVATGLRFDEAIESYRLIAQLNERGNLSEYYNAETETLEHFRFKERFIRRTKKAFMSFVSKQMIKAICSSGFKPTQDVIRKRMQRAKLGLKFGDLRELNASYSIKNLKQVEIDFLHGRLSASVFMQFYFNPVWLADLQKRAIKNANELLELAR